MISKGKVKKKKIENVTVITLIEKLLRGVGAQDCHCANRVLSPTSGVVFLCVGRNSRMDDVCIRRKTRLALRGLQPKVQG